MFLTSSDVDPDSFGSMDPNEMKGKQSLTNKNLCLFIAGNYIFKCYFSWWELISKV